MRPPTCIITLASLATLAMAGNNGSTLFVSSYAGNITSLKLTRSAGQYSLAEISATAGCLPNPSWLTVDHGSKALYCLNEGLVSVNGSLTSFHIEDDGSLAQVSSSATPNGPVSGAIYGNLRDGQSGKKGLALAHYGGSAVSSWELNSVIPNFTKLQDFTYQLTQPGAVPDRQDAPHEHEAIVDPTGKYILVPDLGADVVRVFNYDNDARLAPLQSLATAPGYGPRHGVFYKPHGDSGDDKTFFYVVGELSNNVTGYAVTYLPNNGGLIFNQIYESSAFGNFPVPAGNAVAEVALSPDSRFLVISNRDTNDVVPSKRDVDTHAQKPSDSLSTFAVNDDGSLTFQDAVSVGGKYPRHFSMNQAGDLVAVGLQLGAAVVLLERDVKTGKIGKTVAEFPIEGQVTCVRWNEPVFDGTYSNPA